MAAWADAEVRRWTGVPERRDLAAAERWIGGDSTRRESWASLDLVIERAGAVVGEVGLSHVERTEGAAEVGWWTASARRGTGIASAAVRTLVGWALDDLGLRYVNARCARGNPASVAVARRAGLVPVEDDGDVTILVACRR